MGSGGCVERVIKVWIQGRESPEQDFLPLWRPTAADRWARPSRPRAPAPWPTGAEGARCRSSSRKESSPALNAERLSHPSVPSANESTTSTQETNLPPTSSDRSTKASSRSLLLPNRVCAALSCVATSLASGVKLVPRQAPTQPPSPPWPAGDPCARVIQENQTRAAKPGAARCQTGPLPARSVRLGAGLPEPISVSRFNFGLGGEGQKRRAGGRARARTRGRGRGASEGSSALLSDLPTIRWTSNCC